MLTHLYKKGKIVIMKKQTGLALVTAMGLMAVISATFFQSTAVAQDPKTSDGKGSRNAQVRSEIDNVWVQPAWEPRLTLSYDQYMIKCMEDRKIYKSEEEARQRLKKNPKDWIAYVTLAQEASYKQDWQETFRYYRQAMKLHPTNYRVMYSFASLLLSFEKTETGKKEAVDMLQILSRGHYYQETRNARLRLRELGFKTPDPEAEFVTDPYTGKHQ
jgi:tetratricopeptide (TPR) repeat protein